MGKRIIIYGGSGGIGSAIARNLHSTGSELHLVGRSEEKLKRVTTELQASYTAGDVCDETLFTQVHKDFAGPIDGIVYSVGTITLGSIRRLTSADFLQDFKVNAMGAALAIKGGLSSLKKSSIHGQVKNSILIE